MNLKTLHLTNAWHATSGGVGTFYRALLEAANRHRRHVRLVVPAAKTGMEEVGPYARIYTVQAPRAPFDQNYRVLMPHRFLFQKTEVQRILNAERPELIEICDKYSLNYLGGVLRRGWLTKLPYRPVVVGLSCERFDRNIAAYLASGPIARNLGRFYMKWLYFPMFDHHIAVSEHVAAELRPASRGHCVRRGVWVCPMGVDDMRFTPALRNAEFRARLVQRAGARPDSLLMLYAGRLAQEKNLPLLVGTLGRLAAAGRHDYRLLVAGSGSRAKQFEKDCERVAPGRVAMLGHVTARDELAQIYANCDVFLHPNPQEPFGIAPLEAMAAGVALVAPRSGGVLSYAHDGNAWLAEPEPTAFAAAVEQAMSDPADLAARLAAARRTAEDHSWPEAAHRYLQLYEEIHARVRGLQREWVFEPKFYSTQGDWLGAEFGGQ